MEDTPDKTRTMTCPQIQANLYRFDGNETHSPSIIALPVHVDPYNAITEFYMIDVESPHNAILGRSWIQ